MGGRGRRAPKLWSFGAARSPPIAPATAPCGRGVVCLNGMPCYDEMHGWCGDGEVRAVYEPIERWLARSPPELLEARRRQAELLFRRIGITFAVYGEADASERLIPFDIVPRVISRTEWETLERGLRQRVAALNAFLADLYGPQESIRAGVVPSDLIWRNPHYLLEAARRRHRAQGGQKGLRIGLDRGDVLLGQELGEQPHHRLAVLQHVGDA